MGSAPQTGYDQTLFEPIAAVEDRHFWFKARNHIIGSLMPQLLAPFGGNYRVLEIGCGTGNVLRMLEQVCGSSQVVGIDLFLEGLAFARQRTGVHLVQGDLQHSPFETKFHVIGLFDVLEHLPDDVNVLASIHNMMADTGRLILTVPAHQNLWSYFDAQHHYRRYSTANLFSRLEEAGFQVEFLTQYMSILYPLVWLGRRLASKIDQRSNTDASKTHDLTVQEMRVVPFLNDVLTWILSQEAQLLRRHIRLPFGTSLLAIAKKT